MNADKDVLAFLAPLLPLFKEVQPLPVNSERGLRPNLLEGLLRSMGAVVRSAPERLDRAFLDALPGERILVTGSFYLAGEVQKLLCGAAGDALPLTDPAR